MNSTNIKDDNSINVNNKVTIKDESKDYYEIEKSKDYIISKFGGTSRTILSTIISSIYTLTFFILLVYYNEKKNNDNEGTHQKSYNDCQRLKRWNRALYIGLGVSFIFFILCTILQIINQGKEKYITIILLIRTVFNYIVGLFFLIAITVVCCSIDNHDLCSSVYKVDIVYIILEWIIFSFCIVIHYMIVIFFLCCKAKRKPWNGDGDVDPEEMKKVI